MVIKLLHALTKTKMNFQVYIYREREEPLNWTLRREEGKAKMVTKIIVSVLFGGFVVLFLHLYQSLVLKPRRQRLKLGKQGIKGPTSSFLLGNIPQIKTIHLNLNSAQAHHHHQAIDIPYNNIGHDWSSIIFPHLQQWQNQYGTPFLSFSSTRFF